MPPQPETPDTVEDLVGHYRKKKRIYELFLKSVEAAFTSEHALNSGTPAVIHSTKSRLKDDEHLAEKINRKRQDGRVIGASNLFQEITDFAGLRVLHLHQSQFEAIHKFVEKKIKNKTWALLEKPVAYTWDPDSVTYFKQFKLRTDLKPSYYTSVHYLISPANDENHVCCEVQVRTLFEEAWGEIDHSINYPNPTDKIANIEQLRVLSRLVSTGSRLADSIFKIHNSQSS
ncbi:ppGpp synthetase/RelA/SpoT-type nucleotidyltransferase [Pseudacidovorax intermedius]|uniref:PpGpp synthetase/RelA/SpoT-type nucleotidyltransferase n=1 Tax=Pseudacidovorax intermedius TaxID=433924 RepID=A0A370F6J1_9BURK|nr:RelA/SpoT domain-containing protein [Pseudacidovorax intermedius]RDI19595.1 ppGpp synthetase/RelA/SpoT-type nucleotidyltransferase [Pseudacidovorax intermedius]